LIQLPDKPSNCGGRDREGTVFAGSDTRTPRSGIPTLREYARIIGNFLHGLGENDPEHEPFNQG
jgi:hypothetical protein